MNNCDYGCGQPASYTFMNGKHCCSKNVKGCPVVNEKAASKKRGVPCSQETKDKIGNKLKGRTFSDEWKQKISASNTGKIQSEEAKRKCSLSKMGDKNPNYGKATWNKGLTAENNIIIQQVADAQRGIPKNHSPEGLIRIKENGFRMSSGKNNYWHGKSRSKELSPRYQGEQHNSEFRRYRGKVTQLTEKTYRDNISRINPLLFPRTKAGVKDGYQLDHIISVKLGFDLKLDPAIIADVRNLQMLPWEDNIAKYDGKGNRNNSMTEDTAELLSLLIETYTQGNIT